VKKSTAALIALAVFIASWVTGQVLDFPVTDNLALMTLIAVGLVLAFYYLRFEEKRADAKLIAMIGSLTALSVAGRVLFAAIPSVQPCTFIIIVKSFSIAFCSACNYITVAVFTIFFCNYASCRAIEYEIGLTFWAPITTSRCT